MPTIASDFMVAVCLLHLEVGEGGVFNSYVKSHPVQPRNRYGLGNGGRVKNLRTSEFFPVQVRDNKPERQGVASLGKKMKSSRDEKLADYVAPQVGEIIHLIRARKTRDNCSTILGFDMRRLKSQRLSNFELEM